MNRQMVVVLLLGMALMASLCGCSASSVGESPSATDGLVANPTPPPTSAADTALSHDVAIEKPTGDLVEISERLFIAQTNDIYINADDYLGKTIKYEGIFKTSEWEGQPLYYVIRYGPGCCGYDGEAGFEIVWEGPMPEEDDWTEAIGVLESYDEDGYSYLRLRLSSLTVLEVRGEEFVST